jgi:hypothetical protein
VCGAFVAVIAAMTTSRKKLSSAAAIETSDQAAEFFNIETELSSCQKDACAISKWQDFM